MAKSNAVVLASTKGLSRGEWLRIRKTGVGSSDAPGVVGASRWKTPLSVFLEKTADVPEIEDNRYMRWGRVLEPIVAQEFAAETGLKVRRKNAVLKSRTAPFMLANLDFETVCPDRGKGVVEVKTAARSADWEDGPPVEYQVQTQHQLAVTGYAFVAIPVLIGGNDFRIFFQDRDDAAIELLTEIERQFWVDYVATRTPPEIDGSDSSAEILKSLFPQASEGKYVILPDEARESIERYHLACQDLKQVTALKQQAENELRLLLEDAEAAYLPGGTKPVVTWKSQIRKAYSVPESTSRVLRVKEVKE